MSRLRFNQGELVRIVGMPAPGSMRLLGSVVEVIAVGPFAIGSQVIRGDRCVRFWIESDYLLDTGNGPFVCALDHHLAPLDPPAEPASLTRSTHLEEPANA